MMPSTELAWLLGLFFAAGLAFLFYGLYTLRASLVAGRWPTTEGRILSCELKEYGDSESTTYTVEAKYAYSVDGTAYEGTRIAFGYGGTSGRASHQEIADRLISARSVVVRYNPTNPGRAVLSYGLNRSTVIILVVGFTLVAFIMGFGTLWYLSNRSDTGLLSTLITRG